MQCADGLLVKLVLGDDAFAATVVELADPYNLRDVSRAKRRPIAKPLTLLLKCFNEPKQDFDLAYQTGTYSMREIGEVIDVHEVTVGREIWMWEN